MLLVAPPDLVEGGVRMIPIPLNWGYVAVAGLVSFVILITGYHNFNRLKWRFVERP
jgi:hypothetical protein